MAKDIGAALRALLIADADIAALVGPRVYADSLPQGSALPAIVYHSISGVPEDCLSGPVLTDTITYQIDSYAQSRGDAHKLWELVRNAVAGFRGSSDGIYIKGVGQSNGPYDITDRPLQGTDEYRYRTVADYLISYDS